MWTELLVTSALVKTILSASLVHCPERSTCLLPGDHLEATSFDFLNKLTQKQYQSIVNLTIPNADITKIDPKLKYLKNLQYLDLSHNNVVISSIPSFPNLKVLKLNGNNLKNIKMSVLPQNIEILDISHNNIAQLPRDWRALKSLKMLYLYKNPIDCDCSNVMNYDRIVKSGISVPGSITCHSPKKFIGKEITALNCSLDDIMLSDEPEEGSGSVDIVEDDLYEKKMNVPFVPESENEVNSEDNTIIYDKLSEEDLLEVPHSTVNTVDEVLEEGSGDEGSGFEIPLPESGILGCIENCSTPGPVGANDEVGASPPPSAVNQIEMFFDSVNVFKHFGEKTSTPAIEGTTTETTPTIIAAVQIPVTEPTILKESEPELRQSDKNPDVELVITNSTSGEFERASAVPQNSTAVYAVVGIIAFMTVIFLVCLIKKRNSKRRNKKRHELPNSLGGEELKPLSKPPIQAINNKPIKNSSNIPEHIPLINGKNGTPRSDSPKLKSFTPLAHPEILLDHNNKEDELDEPLTQNGHTILSNGPEDDDVDIRPKFQPELLTPQRERVTIRESEIPDSIPKTPLLIHRQKNSEGEIVTTVVP